MEMFEAFNFGERVMKEACWINDFSDPARLGAQGDPAGVDPKAFQRCFGRQGRFTAGMGTHCRPSTIGGETTHQALARGCVTGMRFHSAPGSICEAFTVRSTRWVWCGPPSTSPMCWR
jgi:hypothetical protein